MAVSLLVFLTVSHTSHMGCSKASYPELPMAQTRRPLRKACFTGWLTTENLVGNPHTTLANTNEKLYPFLTPPPPWFYQDRTRG